MADTGAMDVEPNETGAESALDYYFDSYSHFGIHEEMLKDYTRTMAYKKAIVNNPQIFKDKVVLDVGCGTGILSMFAAQAGARHVIGVDCANIAESAKLIVKENGFEGRITIIQGKIEEIEMPEEYPQVDVIISEWMGYFLLYESMVDSVIFARDKWMVPGGTLMPDKARMFIAGIEDEAYLKQKIGFWDDVYGFKMSCIKEKALLEPLVDVVPPAQVCSTSCTFKEFDFNTATVEDLEFAADFEIQWSHKDTCHALTAWFDVEFSKCHMPVGLNTSPFTDYTHWKQTVFYFDTPLRTERDQTLTGTIDVRKHRKNHRDLKVHLSTKSHIDNTEQSRVYYIR